MKHKVLIVGGAGYIGGLLTDLLDPVMNHNIENVTVYDSLCFNNFYFKKGLSFIYGDVRDYKLLSKHINNYDTIVWLAAHVGDGACTIHPEISLEINRDTVKFLSENYNGKIIFTSSCSVYGKNDSIITEESPVNPLSLYAESKVEAEKYLINKNALIFRLGTLYGQGDNFTRPRMDLVGNLLVFKAFYEKKLTVFGGNQYRPILDVNDVAFQIMKSIIDSVDKTGIYNLGGENLTILDMAKRINKYIPDAKIIETDIPTEDQRNYRVDSSKAKKELNFCNYLNYDDCIKEWLKILNDNRIIDWKNPFYNNHYYFDLHKPYINNNFPAKQEIIKELENKKLTSII